MSTGCIARAASPILTTMNPEKATRWIAKRLHDHYGEISVTTSDPLEELISTILSQNTNDTNRDRAYTSLLSHFGDLNKVRQASVDEIAETIQVGGLHRQKSSRIKLVLERITRERGSLDLSFLADLPLDRAMEWLLSSPGVGKKTAGIVLLFSFDKPYFPVDTHIRRVTTRLGLVGENDDPHQRMNALLPPDSALMRRLHLQLIRLGREICHPHRPECPTCPLSDHCVWRTETF